jgi:hypothetical protein
MFTNQSLVRCVMRYVATQDGGDAVHLCFCNAEYNILTYCSVFDLWCRQSVLVTSTGLYQSTAAAVTAVFVGCCCCCCCCWRQFGVLPSCTAAAAASASASASSAAHSCSHSRTYDGHPESRASRIPCGTQRMRSQPRTSQALQSLQVSPASQVGLSPCSRCSICGGRLGHSASGRFCGSRHTHTQSWAQQAAFRSVLCSCPRRHCRLEG